ncbi:MAG: flagellin lysine-N-methylase [Rickettsiales bacterium]
MATPLLRAAFLDTFQCLGAECEDTCCKGWGMQVTKETIELYQKEAPELLDAVTTGEAEHIMRRDPVTDHCVKFESGLCGIHRTRGTDFLGDACHFFPRITRSLGNQQLMTAALSCPEVTRLALLTDSGFDPHGTAVERLPFTLKNYLPEGISEEDAILIHHTFLTQALNEQASAERILSRISSVARSLEMMPVTQWKDALPFYFKMADGRLPVPEAALADPFNLVHLLNMLISASKMTPRPRLDATITSMAHALSVVIEKNPPNLITSDGSMDAWHHLIACYHQLWFKDLQPILKRWIAAQLSIALFPFSGFGSTLTARISIIGVRFATIKLALISTCHAYGYIPAQPEIVRAIQSIARFMDHLAEPTSSLDLYTQTGWIRESRLRSLIGDMA